MQPVVCTCRATGHCVDIGPREAVRAADHDVAVECAVCGLNHFVMPESGAVMSAPQERGASE